MKMDINIPDDKINKRVEDYIVNWTQQRIRDLVEENIHEKIGRALDSLSPQDQEDLLIKVLRERVDIYIQKMNIKEFINCVNQNNKNKGKGLRK